jgi:hypothetical protein
MLLFSFSHIPVRLPYVVSIGQYSRFFCSWQAPRWEISGGAAAWVNLSNKLDKEAGQERDREDQALTFWIISSAISPIKTGDRILQSCPPLSFASFQRQSHPHDSLIQ